MALSPQQSKYSARIAGKNNLSFDVLDDRGNGLCRRLGLVFELPDELREVYLVFGIDLERFNGDGSWTLPMPARYIVDKEGIIRHADVHPDYTKRPEPESTIEVLGQL